MAKTAISHLKDEVHELYNQHLQYKKVAQVLCERHPDLPSWNYVRGLVQIELSDELCNEDILTENARLRKHKLKTQDKLRVERRNQRDSDRKENATEELLTEIHDNLKSIGKSLKSKQRYSGKFESDGVVMVVHLSDLHMQEMINLQSNKFDFIVAAKRLQLFAKKIKALGECYDCKRIVLAIGGDIINSDRRIDEMLINSTNRSRAVVLSAHILRQFILDLREKFYIDVVGVCGNEGRAKQELGWSDVAATDSYDALVYFFLTAMLDSDNDKGLRFNNIQANECLFTIHKETFLLLHGHQIRMTDAKVIQSVVGKFAARGINITHILAGHIHSAMISDFASRSSSLCGSNAYSEAALSFVSKASQNVHIVSSKHLDGCKIDLQNVEDIEGYDCMNELQRHGARTLEHTPTPDTQISPIEIC